MRTISGIASSSRDLGACMLQVWKAKGGDDNKHHAER